MAKIPWQTWARWFLPLMLILVLMSLALLVPPVLMRRDRSDADAM